jgi:hypothetical protein
MRYKTGTKILTCLCQDTSTQFFYYHIHEWRCRCIIIKENIHDQLLTYWFTKCLLLPITKYVAKSGVETEEKSILHAQHLYLIHFQYDTLYDIIPHASRLSIDPHKSIPRPHVDDMVGSIFIINGSVGLIEHRIKHKNHYTHHSNISSSHSNL